MRDISRVEIDLGAIEHNMRVLRRVVGPDCAICPVVKADAYGLGAARIARCLAHAGAEMLAVYTADQASEVIGAGVAAPLLVLMPVRDIDPADEIARGLVGGLVGGRVHLSVHDERQLEELDRIARTLRAHIPVHVEIDTGMCRGGCSRTEAASILRSIAASRRLRLAGIYTHFASAESDEPFTRRQDDDFGGFVAEHSALIPPGCIVHAANTCATIREVRFHRSMVRVGQAWAGYGPESVEVGLVLGPALDLRPSVTFSSRIIHVKTIEAGSRVGYGATWTAPARTRIGLIPVGYADGYPLALSAGSVRADEGAPRDRAVVAVLDGQRRWYAPVVGRVNMDQITIDLGLIDERGGTVEVGSAVELISPDRAAPNHLARLARIASTSPYEILCRLSPRLPRLYHGDAQGIEILAHEPVAVG